METQENTEEIREFYEEQLTAQRGMLSSAIDELQKKNSQLENTLEKLTQRNGEISQISYRTYHEMRGPMVTLLGVLDLVRSEVENETVNSLLDQAAVLINRLDQFSNSLTNYTKIIQNDFFAECIEIELLTKKLKAELSNLEGVEKVNFSLDLDGNFKRFYFDKLRIATLFKILITNSVRYRDIDKEECFCKVKVKDYQEYIEITISDNGMGIAEDAQPRIFNMFYRGSEVSQGSGLGLYVVNTIVKEVGGEINLTSKEGIGTTVKISLPNQQ